MPIGSVHTVGPLVFTHASTSDFNIDGVDNGNLSTEVTTATAYGAGQARPSHSHARSGSPMWTGTTTDIATALSNIPHLGLAIDSGGSAFTSLDTFLTQMADLGSRSSGSAHYRVRFVKALVVLGTLTLEHQGDATLSLEFNGIYDGTNDPIQPTEGNALPHVASIDEKFTLGPVVLNGTALPGVQRVTINFGVTVGKESGSGDFWQTFGAVYTIDPSVEIVTKEVPTLNDYGIQGTAISASDVVIYAKKYADTGVFTADNTAEHISLTLDEGFILPTNSSGGNNTSQDCTVVIRPTYDGTNEPIVVNTAATLP